MVVITFSGLHGAGKSTHAKQIAEEFGLRYVSAGDVARKVARDRGLTLTELTDLTARDASIDNALDDMTRREAKKGSVVLDGQLAGWMARDFADIKVYLRAPLSIRVGRLASRDGVSLEEATKELLHREEAERERYKSLYGIDVGDISIYEVILDTSLLGLESTREVLKTIVREYISTRNR
jgi:cytidylate kinase